MSSERFTLSSRILWKNVIIVMAVLTWLVWAIQVCSPVELWAVIPAGILAVWISASFDYPELLDWRAWKPKR